MADASDPADDAEEAVESKEADSTTDLLLRFGRDVSVLALCETQLALSRNVPEVRRTFRDVAAAGIAAIAFLTVFVFVNVAAMLALSSVLSPWLAALVLATAWMAVGAVLSLALLVRAEHLTGWKWWRVSRADPTESLKDLEHARAQAEQEVRETLERLAPAISSEIASAALSMATGMAGGVLEVGEDILEASDDLVETIAEEVPGGGLVTQVWDLALMPGRFGLRVATTVIKGGEPKR